MRHLVLLTLACLAIPLAGCGDDPSTRATQERRDGPLRVYAVNHPLAAMAARIGGDAIEVTFPAPAGVDPAFWRPSDAIVAAYQDADLVLLNGANYAKWVQSTTLPRRALLHTSAGFADRYLETSGGVTHSHGPEGEHSHAGIAYTTWLDLDQAAQQAAEIVRALVARDASLKPQVTRGYEALRAELEGLDRRLKVLGAAKPAMIGSHPVYQYLARRYGFAIESMDWSPGVMPTDEQWHALDLRLLRHPATVFLWEATPPAEATERLKPTGLTGVVFDPCAHAPAQGDFVDTMRANVERLEAALAPK